MATELKGRYADYYSGDKSAGTVEWKTRLSLNQVKVIFGADIARELVAKKRYNLGNTHWLELELLPGEKNADETAKETLKLELVEALYQDLRESLGYKLRSIDYWQGVNHPAGPVCSLTLKVNKEAGQ